MSPTINAGLQQRQKSTTIIGIYDNHFLLKQKESQYAEILFVRSLT